MMVCDSCYDALPVTPRWRAMAAAVSRLSGAIEGFSP